MEPPPRSTAIPGEEPVLPLLRGVESVVPCGDPQHGYDFADDSLPCSSKEKRSLSSTQQQPTLLHNWAALLDQWQDIRTKLCYASGHSAMSKNNMSCCSNTSPQKDHTDSYEWAGTNLAKLPFTRRSMLPRDVSGHSNTTGRIETDCSFDCSDSDATKRKSTSSPTSVPCKNRPAREMEYFHPFMLRLSQRKIRYHANSDRDDDDSSEEGSYEISESSYYSTDLEQSFYGCSEASESYHASLKSISELSDVIGEELAEDLEHLGLSISTI